MDLDQFIAQAAEKREAFRLSRHAWAAEIEWPIPKRRRKNKPDPGSLDWADADEEG